jgi:fibro-slime domain-containing protein
VVWACAANEGSGLIGSKDTNGDGVIDDKDASGGSGPGIDLDGREAPAGCGNGELTKDEACDDGNKTSGDGCASNCLSVEAGYSCNPPGVACHHVARCGDGVVVMPELCDDGNKDAGDGCSPTCKFEPGYKCDGAPSTCTRTTCGDGVIEGAESCEDGNSLPFDGCSALCQNEPDCKNGACQSECGDGIVLNEACDDGNKTDGDGCSADCKPEDGFECLPPEVGDSMKVPAIFRDFRARPAHQDFEPQATGQEKALLGIAATELDADGKPVLAIATPATGWIQSASSYAQWYRDVPGINSTSTGELVLWNKGDGSYVNRYGKNGEQWKKTKIIHYCGTVKDAKVDEAGNPIPCTSKWGETDCDKATGEILECYIEPSDNNTYKAIQLVELVDGNPLFFPVDGDSFTPESERAEASLASPMYTDNGWPLESTISGEVTKHNFHFTSEVRYWFQFDASKTYTLDFTGDDDVWVFINKKLAVDIGGIHTPVNGSVTLDPTTASTFGLEDGKVYEIALFQAERQKNASTYKLTLSGFTAGSSNCRPICGDGILGIGEECDDGKNDGGYGECAPGCVLDTFCGDGVKQDNEDCDDGNNLDGDGCGSACRDIVLL